MKPTPHTEPSFTSQLNTGKPLAHAGKAKKASQRKASILSSPTLGWNMNAGLGGLSNNAYTTSYASMGRATGAYGDVPLHFALMNQNNGGILYWPTSLKEKYSWYRYFARVDPYVKRAVEFHTDLPMSKLILRMPKMEDKDMREQILRKYSNMIKRIKLFDRLHSMLFECNVIGNAYVFCEFNEELKEWEKLVILPPEEIMVSKYPMSDVCKIMYRPEMLNSILRRESIPVDSYEHFRKSVDRLPPDKRDVLNNIPFDLAKQLIENEGSLIMDTSPFSGDGNHKVGSFAYQFAERRHDYYDIGVSPLECVLVPLLMKEHYKYTQLSLASRNLTPRNKITAPDINEEALAQLREQVDMSMLDPDYTIVTNYDFNWEQIGAENRLLDLSKENEWLDEQFFAGLGVTKEILTGEGMYSGSKIAVELLNTRYLLKREMLQNFVEECLFLPVAEENGFYKTDSWGNKTYFYPKLSFTRLTIRDNAEVFDSLFQLYQKGSVPISVILDLFNLDSDEILEKLKQDQFTVNDPTYNDMMRGIYSDISQVISGDTDLADQIIATMTGPEGKPLKKIDPDAENTTKTNDNFFTDTGGTEGGNRGSLLSNTLDAQYASGQRSFESSSNPDKPNPESANTPNTDSNPDPSAPIKGWDKRLFHLDDQESTEPNNAPKPETPPTEEDAFQELTEEIVSAPSPTQPVEKHNPKKSESEGSHTNSPDKPNEKHPNNPKMQRPKPKSNNPDSSDASTGHYPQPASGDNHTPQPNTH